MIDQIKLLAKEYLEPAFQITKKEIKIYIVLVFIAAINFLASLVHTKGITTLLFMLFQFAGWAYTISIPFFFSKYLENQKVDIKIMVEKTLLNVKRLIIPGVILFFLLQFVLIFAFAIFIVQHGTVQKITASEMQSYMNLVIKQLADLRKQPLLYLFGIPSTIFYSMFVFHEVFFTLKHRGFFVSFLDSFRFSLKNMGFIYLISLYSLLTGLVALIYPFPITTTGFMDLNLRIIIFIVSLVVQYFSLVKVGTATLYFLKKGKV